MFDEPAEPAAEAETQPAARQTPPAGPPAAATAGDELGPSAAATAGDELGRPGKPGWSVLEVLPVVLFLLFLAGLSMLPGPQPPPTRASVRMVLVVQSFFYLLILLFIYSVVRLKHGLPFWQGLGWQRVNGWFFITCGVVLAFAVQLLQLPVGKELPIERLFQTREGAFLLAGFGVLVAPLVEEIIFRGFIFAAAQRAWGLNSAVWTTALLFAGIHVPQLRGGTPQVISIFGVGLLLSWVRGRTGALTPPYFMHVGYNGTMFAMLFIATRGFQHFG